MAKRHNKRSGVKVATIEGLAGMIADLGADVQKGFDDVNKGFDAMSSRFDRIEAELEEIKRTLDRIDTRLAALEFAVFGATRSDGGRISANSILDRLDKLEHTVFRK